MKVMHSILWCSLVYLMVLPLVSADVDEENVFKQNTVVDLKRNCDYQNGTLCPIDTNCFMTITSPTQGNIIVNKRMGNLSTNYPNWNVTLTPSNNIEIGIYTAAMSCTDKAGLTGSETFYYEVTPSGSRNILGLFIILIGLAYVLTFFGAFYENIFLATIGGIMMIMVGLYTLNNGIDVYRSFATQAVSLITIFVGAYFAVTGGMRLINEGGL